MTDKNKEKREAVLASLRINPFYKHAAMAAGITEETLKNWRDADPDFSGRCEEARSKSLSWFVKKGNSDFILTHADPETFKKIDPGTDSNPLVIIMKYDNSPKPVADGSVG